VPASLPNLSFEGATKKNKPNIQVEHILICIIFQGLRYCHECIVASWLVRLTLHQEVRVQALAGHIVLLILTAPTSTQVYKWVTLM